MATYALPATSCPSIPYRSTPLDHTSATPALYPDESGQAVVSKARVNAISAKVEALAAAACGAYAVVSGLDVTDAGASTLQANISAGWAALDGPVPVDSAIQVQGGLADNAYNWLWLNQSGQCVKTSSVSATPVPAAPSGAVCFLRRVHLTTGVMDDNDASGRMEFRGSTLWRHTGDATVPADTPPSGLIILTQTAGGRYLWDGSAYVALRNQDGRLAKTISDGNYTLTSTEYVKRILSISGTLTAGRDIVLPNIDGWEYIVHNNTTGGFALTFKVTGQAGVAVAASKRAILYCNGTDYVRVTLDT